MYYVGKKKKIIHVNSFLNRASNTIAGVIHVIVIVIYY